MTDVGELDYVAIRMTLGVPVVWNEGEDFGRDPADRGERVLHRPDQAEDLRCALFESVHLKQYT